jgi:probable rRNA maturation factor
VTAPIEISIANEQEVLALDADRFEADVTALAVGAGYEGELSVAVVDDAAIHEMNRRFLDHDWPTDVIAFPLSEGEGEVVVSAERALLEAREREVEPVAELLLYVVHGILHLTGHDDHEPDDAARMHGRSLELLRSVGYRNTIPDRERGGKPRES